MRMMAAVRDRVRFGARLALLALVCALAAPVLDAHPLGADDDPCFAWEVSTGAPRAFSAPSAKPSAPEHCVFCHLQRALGGAHLPAASGLIVPAATDALPPVARVSHTLVAWSVLPSRGPPSRL